MFLSTHRLSLPRSASPSFGQRVRAQAPQGERLGKALGASTFIGGGAILGSGLYNLFHGMPAPLHLVLGMINIWLGGRRFKGASLKDPD